jgi:hypothetical protein
MIYCVIPEPLADELYPRLAEYYDDDPNVEVIIDRRGSERRSASDRRAGERPAAEVEEDLLADGRRAVRDRRRARVPGEFPPVEPAAV